MIVLMSITDFGMLMSTFTYVPKSCNMLLSMVKPSILFNFHAYMSVLISIPDFGMHMSMLMSIPDSLVCISEHADEHTGFWFV